VHQRITADCHFQHFVIVVRHEAAGRLLRLHYCRVCWLAGNSLRRRERSSCADESEAKKKTLEG
jgi:hypothetical protein